MSKIFKVTLASMFAFAFVFTASAAAPATNFTSNMTSGTTGTQVKELQVFLNACSDTALAVSAGATGSAGYETMYFGPATKAAVMKYQAKYGVSTTGNFYTLSRGAANTKGNECGGSTTTTTTTTTGTGALCPNGMTLASNCMTAPTTTTTTTEPLCPNGKTIASNCTQYPTTTVSSVEGYIADIAADATNRVSTVYESEQNKVVNGVRMTARLADQKVESLRLTFKNSSITSSSNFAKYATMVSIMDGTTVLASMPVSAADRSTDDTFTFQFTGLGKVITKDTIGRLSVAVSAVSAMDTLDAQNASWVSKIVDVRTVSPNGVYIVNSATPLPVMQSFTFGKFSTSGVKGTVALASTNPLSYTKEVSKTSTTNDVKLLDFTVKAEVSPLTLRNVPVTVTSSTDQSFMINSVKLMKDGQLVDNVAPGYVGVTPCTTSCAYVFQNLAPSLATIAAGTTATYSVVVDLKAQGNTPVYPNGSTLQASFTGTAVGTWSVVDSNGDQLVAGSRTGSAVGNTISLASTGISTAYVSSSTGTLSSSAASTTTARTYYVDVAVTSFGDTVYVPDIFAAANATGKNSTNTVIAPTAVTISAAPGESITKQGSDFVVSSGETKKFRVAVTLAGTAGSPIQAKVQLTGFNVKVGSAAATATTTVLDSNIYQTSFDTL